MSSIRAYFLPKIEIISIPFVRCGRSGRSERVEETNQGKMMSECFSPHTRNRSCDTYIYFRIHCTHTRTRSTWILFGFCLSPQRLTELVMCGAEKLVWLVFQQQSAICDFFMCVSVSFSPYCVPTFFFFFRKAKKSNLNSFGRVLSGAKSAKFIRPFFVNVFFFSSIFFISS